MTIACKDKTKFSGYIYNHIHNLALYLFPIFCSNMNQKFDQFTKISNPEQSVSIAIANTSFVL